MKTFSWLFRLFFSYLIGVHIGKLLIEPTLGNAFNLLLCCLIRAGMIDSGSIETTSDR